MNKFRLSDEFVDQYRGKQPEWSPIGYIVFKRTYARDIEENGVKRLEEYWETCRRVVEGTFELQRRHIIYLNTRWNTTKAQHSAQEMFRLMWEFKFLPPGRGLYNMGSKMVMEMGIGAVLFNCGYISTADINNDFAEPFVFTFEASAHQIGVGFDTRGEGKVKIVEPKQGEDTFVVADTREGWSELLHRVLDAYVGIGSVPKSIDYSLVRPKGSPIKTMGGTASGPESLKELIEIDIPKILTPGKITSTHIVDLENAIGKCVVTGAQRRSAEIALGRIDDKEFRDLKLDTEKLKDWRWASNNSHICPPEFHGFEEFVDPIFSRGEPGFIFLENCKKYGRIREDDANYRDVSVEGINPCGEQTLESGETCNVVEVFITRCKDLTEFKRAIKMAYLYGKTVTLTKTPWPKTNEIMLRNRRIGLSMTGIIQNINRLGMAEHIRWCEEGYKYVQELDKTYSNWLCIPRSIKTTTVKPSGTVSKLPGPFPQTSGVHYPKSEYYIQNVRFTKGSKILQVLEEAGYPVEDCVYNKGTRVVSFPIKEGFYFKKCEKDITLWEQLENAAQMQEHWSDNSVSITVSLKEHERGDLVPALERYQSRLKAVSFLPEKHDYEQAPWIPITEEKYNQISSLIKPIDLAKALNQAEHELTEKFCDSDICQIT